MSEALVKDAVAKAVAASDIVNTAVKTDLTAGQIADIAAHLPPPAGMEALWPQLGRQLLVAIGGALTAKGLLSSEDWALYSGIIVAAAPIVYRIVQTYAARKGVKLI